jgi:predicted nucleic acid-binding protein
MTSFPKKLKGHKVALDTMVFIYAFENHPSYLSLVKPLLHEIEQGEMEGVTSTLTVAECLVQPYKKKDTILAAQYWVLFRNFPHLSILPLTEEIADRTAFLRAHYQLRTPDAIQLATAFIADCDVFLTNDVSLPPVEGIQILVLDRLLQ